MRTTIKQVDHVIVKSKFPLKFFEFFTETLEVPVAWPLKTVRGLIVNGAVYLGNINLEVIKAGLLFELMGAIPRRYGIVGIAFEPNGSLENITKELDVAGISRSSIKPFRVKAGKKDVELWNSLNLKKVLPGAQIFYRKYSQGFDEKRIKPKNEFKKRNGGPAGIEYVKEIVIGYAGESILEEWKKLLYCEEQGDSWYISFKNGPAIRLVKSDKTFIKALLIKVSSLESAKEFLISKNSVGSISENEISINPEMVEGIEIRLCQE